jgi:hypothetical protein
MTSTTDDAARDLDPILRALAAPGAVIALGSVPEVLGLDAATAAGLVADLSAGGWVSIWGDHPAGPGVVLSALAASRLNLELETPADSTAGKWVPIGTARPEPAQRRRDRVAELESDQFLPFPGSDVRPAGLDGLADPNAADPAGPEPSEKRRLGRGPREIPAPVIIINPGRPWPVAELPPARPCPVCRGRSLTPREACIYCGRTGVDGLIPPRPLPPRARKFPAGLAGGVGGKAAAKPGRKKAG